MRQEVLPGTSIPIIRIFKNAKCAQNIIFVGHKEFY